MVLSQTVDSFGGACMESGSERLPNYGREYLGNVKCGDDRLAATQDNPGFKPQVGPAFEGSVMDEI